MAPISVSVNEGPILNRNALLNERSGVTGCAGDAITGVRVDRWSERMYNVNGEIFPFGGRNGWKKTQTT